MSGVRASGEQAQQAQQAQQGRVPVTVRGEHIVVGPWETDGQRGCQQCALAWWSDVSPHTAGGEEPHLPEMWRDVVAGLVDEFAAPTGADPAARRLLVLSTRTGEVTRHRFAVHPDCARCSGLPADGAAPSAVDATPLDLTTPQPSVAGPLRTRRIHREHLRERLLDFRFGPVAHTYRDEESPLALVTCETVVPGRAAREGGYGRSADFAGSELPGFLEGVERVRGGYRRPDRSVVVASYDQVAGQAVDPRTLGEHDPVPAAREPAAGTPDRAAVGRTPHEQPQRPHGFVPYDPGAETSWVWAWSTLRRSPVLVPEHVAFWHETGTGARFFYESSNGCAVGGTLEEAALHGLCEVIERDAFLLAWYSRSRLREVVLDLQDPGLADLAPAVDLLAERGLRLRVLDLTSDFGVPVALAMITAPQDAVRAGLAPAMSLASGAGLDGRAAIRTAVEECLTNAVMYPKWVRMRADVSVERCRPMLDDYSLVRTLEDHTGMHGLWEARGLWEFLDRPAGTISVAEFADAGPGLLDDVATTLSVLTERAHALGCDVVVVDQTGPDDAAELGVHAAKVIVPGAMPMTFGHLNRRTVGLPRLGRASTILRGAQPWTTETGPYTVPHPFP
ncbi:TOMM precursor leader peptide-binding protein [Promicromonospora sp. NPDC090134]|uniref:TOMM precursor leader peptide-binding protein n=1 Tax=Promicromonospora sp. NPDC090134 TaxID=3364408 RepID=UPI0037F81C3C